MQLDIGWSQRFNRILNLADRMVHEHADLRHMLWHDVGDLSCDVEFDESLACAIEVESERIGAGIDGRLRIVGIRYSADLDPKHAFIIRPLAMRLAASIAQRRS